MEYFALKEQYIRTAMIIGESGVEKINSSKIIIFGVGGVGSYAAEALARCGFKRIDVVDADVVSTSNINRQLIALISTVGRKKVDVIRERIKDISADTVVNCYDIFYDRETQSKIKLSEYDYIVDAIDSIESKILLAKEAKKCGIPIISALSAGNKLDIGKFTVADIFSTTVCPIAKIMRKRLKEENIDELKVVYSTEAPIKTEGSFVDSVGKKSVGSISFVPSAVGLIMAGEVVKDIIGYKVEK